MSDRIAELEAEVERLEVERDDYKDRWEILGRVTKKKIDKLEAEVERLEAQLLRLRETYEAMRLEWSKSVDERDDALTEVERLRKALRSIAGKQRPSGAYCQRVAQAALDITLIKTPEGGAAVTDKDHIETLKRAQMTMAAYATASGPNQYPDDPLTWLSDVLADLQHWAIDRELDWFDALRRAAQYVEEELEEARHEHS